MSETVGNGTREDVMESDTQDTGSKNQVFQAYDELLQKLKATNKTPAPTKQEEKIIEEKKIIIETAAQHTSDNLAKHIAALKTSFNKFLDEFEPKLIAEQKTFETIRQAKQYEEQSLKNLYDIKPQAETLSALVMAYKEKNVTLEQEIKHKRELWQREQEAQEEARKDYETQTQKSRQREEENFIYNRDIFRRKEQEEYEAQKRLKEQELIARSVELEEANKVREAAIIVRENKMASRESEFKQLQEEVRNFPERLQHAAMEAERILAEKLEIKFQYEAKLLQKDFAVERELLMQDIQNLKMQIEKMTKQTYSFSPVGYNTDKISTEV